MEKTEQNANGRSMRRCESERFKEKARMKLGMSTSVVDGAKLWNRAPNSVTSAPSIWQAKKAIKNIARHCQFKL